MFLLFILLMIKNIVAAGYSGIPVAYPLFSSSEEMKFYQSVQNCLYEAGMNVWHITYSVY